MEVTVARMVSPLGKRRRNLALFDVAVYGSLWSMVNEKRTEIQALGTCHFIMQEGKQRTMP